MNVMALTRNWPKCHHVKWRVNALILLGRFHIFAGPLFSLVLFYLAFTDISTSTPTLIHPLISSIVSTVVRTSTDIHSNGH